MESSELKALWEKTITSSKWPRKQPQTVKNSFSTGLVSFSFVSNLTKLRWNSAKKKSGSAQKGLTRSKYTNTDHWLAALSSTVLWLVLADEFCVSEIIQSCLVMRQLQQQHCIAERREKREERREKREEGKASPSHGALLACTTGNSRDLQFKFEFRTKEGGLQF